MTKRSEQHLSPAFANVLLSVHVWHWTSYSAEASHIYHINCQDSFVTGLGCSQHWQNLGCLWGPAMLLRSSQEDGQCLLKGTPVHITYVTCVLTTQMQFQKVRWPFPQHPSVYSDTAQICVQMCLITNQLSVGIYLNDDSSFGQSVSWWTKTTSGYTENSVFHPWQVFTNYFS